MKKRITKTKVSVTLDVDLIAWMDGASEDGKFSRSDVVNECLRASREESKVGIRQTGKQGKNSQTSGNTKKVLISVSDDYLEWVDSIVEKADVTRSEVLTEILLHSRKVTGFLNSIGLTAIRRRRIARLLGGEADVPADEEEEGHQFEVLSEEK